MKNIVSKLVIIGILFSSSVSFGEPEYGTDTASEYALEELEKIGLNDADMKAITTHVIEHDGDATYEDLEESGIVSEEGLEQIRDDARLY